MISVVILAYNSASFVCESVDSVLRDHDETNCELIVVDNASEDETYSVLRKRYADEPSVTVLRNEVALGFAAGNNAAALEATGAILLMLNDDCVLESGALEGVQADFANDPRLGIVQCALAT